MVDATVAALPIYFGSMEAERRWLDARARREGPSAADYEKRDTITSLSMGVASLVAPMLVPRVLAPFNPRTGRYGRLLIASAVGAVAVTAIADRIARRSEAERALDIEPESRTRRRKVGRAARKIASAGGVASVVTGGIALTTTWASLFSPERMWEHRIVGDLGNGPLALGAAIFGWDFIYYWNHRFMHESRYMWAIHVVHHSSERYNLSTALRQPVADAFGTFASYGLLCLLGIRPSLILQARGINLLYQYWIHTDAIRQIGSLEHVLNTPSHHRVHHGVNPEYIDRNHGSILILWDRLFGTFQREQAPVIYGLTKNIGTFEPAKVMTHEHADMLRDVGRSKTWKERLSFVLRGPGWAYRRHAELAAAAATAA